MRGRTTSMLDTTSARQIEQGQFVRCAAVGINRQSRSSTALNKMEYTEKIERYKVLLEKEYELRTEFKKQYGNHAACQHRRDDVCGCGRRISHFYSPSSLQSTHGSNENNNNNNNSNNGYLTPPTSRVVRYRSYSNENKIINHGSRTRPLSADVHLEAPNVILRRLATEERMGKRRASLKSLDSDFEKAKMLMLRAKGASNTSLDNSPLSSKHESAQSKHDSVDQHDGMPTNANHTRRNRPRSSYL